jgi:large subunit ribosomal protein L21
MFAVIETGGKQYKVKAGDEVAIERLKLPKAKTLKLDKVLLLSGEGALEVGKPYVKGAYCEAELVKEFRGPKVLSFKYIRREKSATKIGHRQNYLKVKIKSIHTHGN